MHLQGRSEGGALGLSHLQDLVAVHDLLVLLGACWEAVIECDVLLEDELLRLR